MGYVTVTLMTFDKQSNGRRIEVDSQLQPLYDRPISPEVTPCWARSTDGLSNKNFGELAGDFFFTGQMPLLPNQQCQRLSTDGVICVITHAIREGKEKVDRTVSVSPKYGARRRENFERSD